MKKWFRFFTLSFFSDRISREGARRGYTNFFIGLILALAFMWCGFVGAEMLPFGTYYNRSSDFRATVHALLANPELDNRIIIEVRDGSLSERRPGGEYTEGLLVNTFESDADRQSYSASGYNVIVDTRAADTLAEVEAYCLSNDGKGLEITYEEYLTLSEVARMNFDFKLRYTGRELKLDDELVENYRAYLDGLSSENRLATEKLTTDLADGKITKNDYNREIYKLYFTNYYPEITDYESSSSVPLLRNYYYHQYIKEGAGRYLFIFDDYMAGSFETDGGRNYSFYGFYGDVEDGVLISEGVGQAEASSVADRFIKKSFSSVVPLTMYAHAMNIFSLIPFIALMPLVVALLAYSILKLRGIESINSFGALFKILGSYVWFSGLISAVITVIASFFVQNNVITALPLVLFFIALAIRSIVFVIREAKSYLKQLEQETVQTEV